MRTFLLKALAAIVVGSVLGLSIASSVEAKPKPVPSKAWAKQGAPLTHKSRALLTSSLVWISAEQGLGSQAYLSTLFFNYYTETDLICDVVQSPLGARQCKPTPCPTMHNCLNIRWGTFAEGDTTNATYEQVYCPGSCMRAGLIKVNANIPPYGGFHSWGVYERTLVVENRVGQFIGLAVKQAPCDSVMYYTFHCPGGVPHVLNSAEASYAAGW